MLMQDAIKKYVGELYYRRGEDLASRGCVGRISRSEKANGIVILSANVTAAEGAKIYNPAVGMLEDTPRASRCACAGHAVAQRCIHVAALLVAYSEKERQMVQREQMETERRAANRLQALRSEQERFEADQQFLNGLFDDERARRQDNIRLRHEAAGDVRLYPVLIFEDGRAYLKMKMGRKRPYVVNMAQFGQDAARRTRTVFGKEFTFFHTEEELVEQDVALYHHIADLCRIAQVDAKKRLCLEGTQLDSLMRMLLEREVEIHADGMEASARVVEGDVRVEAQAAVVSEESKQYNLKILPGETVFGEYGAYQYDPQAGKIRCMTDGCAGTLRQLGRLAQRYPEGIRLGERNLSQIASALLLPCGACVAATQGKEILDKHMPMAMKPRFLVDMDGRERITCELEYDYGALVLRDGAANPHIRRDEIGEEEAQLCAKRIFPEEERKGLYAFAGKEEEVFDLLTEKLPELRADGEVLISEQLKKINVGKRRAITFGLSQSGTQLLVKADLGGLTQEDLEAAYYAYRQKRRFIRLEDGTFLHGEALRQASETAEVARSLDVTADELAKGASIPMNRAMYLEAALAEREQMELSAPDSVQHFVKRLNDAKTLQADPPATLKATLRPYQLTGYHWLCALSDAGFGGILADDMGLGKTLQALAMLLREKEAGRPLRALVVCPASLQLNWLSEARKFTPDLVCGAMLGTAAQRKALLAQKPGEGAPDVLLVSYDQLQRDIQAYHGQTFTHMLLDEAQYIKNAASQRAKACKAIDAQHRFAMTGTPIENRLSELWSIFDFLMPGYLLPYKKFKDRFEGPIVQDEDEDARKNLRLLTAPFILRRMKKDVLTDLPEKIETVLSSEMTPEQRKQYLAQLARLTGEIDESESRAQRRMKMLAGILKLRQLCCDPSLCLEDYKGGSGKLEQCVELAVNAVQAGHSILLFSQFTTMLDILKTRLEGEGLSTFLLTGSTDKEERKQLADRFNAGEADVFLISLKAGGTGLNLIGADMVIHYDPWWNLAAQNQATDRAFRIGQTKNVQVYKLIASDSIEERIALLQEAKASLSDGVLEDTDGFDTLDEETIRDLLA